MTKGIHHLPLRQECPLVLYSSPSASSYHTVLETVACVSPSASTDHLPDSFAPRRNRMVSRTFMFLLPALGSLCSFGHGAKGGKALKELFREINEGLHAVK